MRRMNNVHIVTSLRHKVVLNLLFAHIQRSIEYFESSGKFILTEIENHAFHLFVVFLCTKS